MIFWGDCPPKKFSKTKKFLFKTSLYGLKYYKIDNKWSENASSEVQKSKIFLPRRRGRPFPWTPSPAAPWASALIIGLGANICSFIPPPKKNSSARPWLRGGGTGAAETFFVPSLTFSGGGGRIQEKGENQVTYQSIGIWMFWIRIHTPSSTDLMTAKQRYIILQAPVCACRLYYQRARSQVSWFLLWQAITPGLESG